MHPYSHRRLTESPDKADLHAEGRPTRSSGSSHSIFRSAAVKRANRRLLRKGERRAAKATISDAMSEATDGW